MPMSSRKRGKLIRRLCKQAKQANRIAASEAVKANLSQPKPAPDFAAKLAKSQGPARFDAKPAPSSRERLKGGSYGVGFQGPRGYGTPKGLVGKQEGNGERLAPLAHPKPLPGATSERFAVDRDHLRKLHGYDGPEGVEEDTLKRRKGKGRFKSLSLNPSPAKPNDAATDRETDPTFRAKRAKAIRLD